MHRNELQMIGKTVITRLHEEGFLSLPETMETEQGNGYQYEYEMWYGKLGNLETRYAVHINVGFCLLPKYSEYSNSLALSFDVTHGRASDDIEVAERTAFAEDLFRYVGRLFQMRGFDNERRATCVERVWYPIINDENPNLEHAFLKARNAVQYVTKWSVERD